MWKATCKALAKWICKTQVENVGLFVTPFGQALRARVLDCDDMYSLWVEIYMQVDTSFSLCLEMFFCYLCVLARKLVNLLGYSIHVSTRQV